MFWKLAADLVFFAHIVWVGAVLLGPIWGWRGPFFRIGHLVLMWGTFLLDASGIYCPLTVAEATLRMHYNPSMVYAGGFLTHYLSVLASWDAPMELISIVIAGWTIGWTVVYALLWWRESRSSTPVIP